MDWLFDNLGKLAPIVIFLLYMISSMKRGDQEEEAPDPEAAERARKIQEEIRRKILERQRGGAEPTGRPPAQPDVIEETIFFDDEPEPMRAPPAPLRPNPVELREEREEAPASVAVDPYVAKRREIEAQLEESKKQREAALAKAKSVAKGEIRSAPQPIESSEIRDRLKGSLDDRDSLKTAVLLKEVLDAPVGMR